MLGSQKETGTDDAGNGNIDALVYERDVPERLVWEWVHSGKCRNGGC